MGIILVLFWFGVASLVTYYGYCSYCAAKRSISVFISLVSTVKTEKRHTITKAAVQSAI